MTRPPQRAVASAASLTLHYVVEDAPKTACGLARWEKDPEQLEVPGSLPARRHVCLTCRKALKKRGLTVWVT